MDLAKLRNLGIVAHIDAGKTTVTERVLNFTGVEHRVGRVDEGTAVMDWMSEERERGITITAAATRVHWQDADINLIDTPGHVDFTVEVERCMRVLDGAVLVIDAVAGVQAQSETVWRQMRRHSVPCVVFVNKCDRVGADFLQATRSLRERLQAPAVPVQYPIYEGRDFVGVIDCLERRAWRFDDDGQPTAVELPAGLADEVGVLRSELVDVLAEGDDAILERVLEDVEPDLATLRAALRRRTLDASLVPVLCGSALRGIGVQPLLDAVVAYLPSPLDRPPIAGQGPDGERIAREPDPDGPLVSLAFKLHAGPHGDLTFVRVYAGSLKTGVKLWNPRVRRMERATRILRMHAEEGVSLDVAQTGDIVALTGLKFTVTGDTLCDRADPILLEPPVFPEPVIQLVVEPASSADRDKLRTALERMAHEDPSFHVREDESTGQWTIEGMGELHLEVQLHRLEGEFKVAARVGQPRVSYRERVAEAGRGLGRVDRVLAGKEVFGAVEVEVLPGAGDHAPSIEWAEDVPVPAPFHEAVAEALAAEAQSGPRFGNPLVGGTVRVVGGDSRPLLDAEPAFVQAAIQALRAALHEARVVLLEPRMAFEIHSPEEFASGIIADLGSRRAEVADVVAREGERVVTGRVALAEMFGYSTVVRSLSQGRASFGMTPEGFVEVPEEELEARGLVWA